MPPPVSLVTEYSSKHRRVTGGKIGTGPRFAKSNITECSPGPAYKAPSFLEEHVTVPRLHKETVHKRRNGEVIHKMKRHPTQDRAAWLYGRVKGEVSYFDEPSDDWGPAEYNVRNNQRLVQRKEPHVRFTRDPRFKKIVSFDKKSNTENLCREGPGPKYRPRLCRLDLTKKRQPCYKFAKEMAAGSVEMKNGGPRLVQKQIHKFSTKDRSCFISHKLKNGYLYNARAATTEAQIGPSRYRPKHFVGRRRTTGGVVVARAPRFSRFGGRKPSPGLGSPGPAYLPTNTDVGKRTLGQRNRTRKGWVP